MKMKAIAGLVIITVMLSGVMVGCAAPAEEEVLRQVSVGRMTVSIPDTWQRPEEHAQMMEDFYSYFPREYRQTVETDAYQVPKSEDVLLLPVLMDMKLIFDLEGVPWEGWETALEDQRMNKEQYVTMISSGFIGEVEELTREVHRQLSVQGNEAWESQFTGKMERGRTRISVLAIFGEDNLGLLMIFVEEGAWKQYEGTWVKIRDSVQLAP